ncbi:MAG: hypothetical protein H6995_08960 [Pseudomonadales bacterium]|nr:phosphodiesterase [Pseudomonadales bacterium]MCP5215123.1 hypothetical protein [Pseudomonadales bacterium]
MKTSVLLLSAALVFVPLASAEVLQISISKQAPELQELERPLNGMTKEDVESKFGPPQEISEPVGNPPISKWRYQNYVVYFEFNTVIHTVLSYQAKDNSSEASD